MRAICLSLILATSVVVALGSAQALAASPHSFALPDHGTLTMAVPDEWRDALNQPPNRLPPTIRLTPRNGAPFEVLITAVWPMGPKAGLTDEITLRTEVAAAAKGAEAQAVEHSLPLKELAGVNGRGFYFVATDRAPKPGEYKYLLKGMIRTGDIALAFTVLTHDGQDAVGKAALEMLRTAVQHPSDTV
jgi:hypothetical protein